MNKLFNSVSLTLLSLSLGSMSYGKTVDVNTAKTIGCNFASNERTWCKQY